MPSGVQWGKPPTQESKLCWWLADFTIQSSHSNNFSLENYYSDCRVIAKTFLDLDEGTTTLIFMAECSNWLCRVKNKHNSGFDMMTSSNGNIFRVTGPLCGEFTGPGEFPTQRPVTRSFDVFFDLRLNEPLSKQPWGWCFETLSPSLWRHRNEVTRQDDISQWANIPADTATGQPGWSTEFVEIYRQVSNIRRTLVGN